ncbi:hypothetical protein HanRHA438_Chr03g0105281 [Helianthus annuus]|nr:hypothetical protein HanRHA438_Chr03g0105281 [Helianthus annuus]
MAPKRAGGLGMGEIRGSNLALLAKWKCKFKDCPSSLWVKVVKEIHRGPRKVDSFVFKSKCPGLWKDIGAVGKNFANRNLSILNNLVSRVGTSEKTLFGSTIGWSVVRYRMLSFRSML